MKLSIVGSSGLKICELPGQPVELTKSGPEPVVLAVASALSGSVPPTLPRVLALRHRKWAPFVYGMGKVLLVSFDW